MFLVPKTDRVKADVVRPLTSDEIARVGPASPTQLARLERKFSKSRDQRKADAREAKQSRNGWDTVIFHDFTPAEVIDFDDDPKDAA